VSFGISIKNILSSGNVIIKVVMRKKKVRNIANSELVRFHCMFTAFNEILYERHATSLALSIISLLSLI
jgi:hypothetical protein